MTIPRGGCERGISVNLCRANTIKLFFRLLDGLRLEHIIERKGKKRTQHDRPGQDPVYYRVPTNYQGIYFLSRSDLIDKLKENYAGIAELSGKLMMAKGLLKESGVSNPDAEIEAKYQSWRVSQQSKYEFSIKKGIKEGSASTRPCIITPDDNVATNRFL